MSRFEWIVALRYLRAKRKQAAISVITVISIVGVAAGVAALIIVLAINNGFQSTLEASLLSATAHVNILERVPQYGIEDWQALIPKLKTIPHVVSATPGLYGGVALKGPLVGSNTILKGVPLGHGAAVPEMLRRLKAGSLAAFEDEAAEQIQIRRREHVAVGVQRDAQSPERVGRDGDAAPRARARRRGPPAAR